jgi:hypothetical protein
VENVKKHFEAFKCCQKYGGIQSTDIFNFDVSGHQIGVATGEKVIISRDCEAAYISDSENKELITVVATVNYGCQKIPPMIIFKGAYHLRKYFDNDLDEDTLFARSESGYTNDILGIKYLEHFNQFIKNSRKGPYRMLIFDGHGSHLNQEFISYC